MLIREATAQDALLISRIIARSWRGAYRGLIDPVYLSRLPEEYWLPAMRGWLASGRLYGLIAETDGTAVGCIIYGRGRDEAYADLGEIVSLYVLPEMMGQGVGTSLVDASMDALRTEGYSRVYLWCIDGNASADIFYQRRGFVRTEDTVCYRIGSGNVTDVRYIQETPHV